MKHIFDRSKWHDVDEDAAKKLISATNSPGVIFPISNTLLPEQLKKMTGVSSYFVSGHTSPIDASPGCNITGEMVVARTDNDLTKNYCYAFRVSLDGSVHFSGPHKGYGHHITSGHGVEISSLFGQIPYGR